LLVTPTNETRGQRPLGTMINVLTIRKSIINLTQNRAKAGVQSC